jgi:hypothetical protein
MTFQSDSQGIVWTIQMSVKHLVRSQRLSHGIFLNSSNCHRLSDLDLAFQRNEIEDFSERYSRFG